MMKFLVPCSIGSAECPTNLLLVFTGITFRNWFITACQTQEPSITWEFVFVLSNDTHLRDMSFASSSSQLLGETEIQFLCPTTNSNPLSASHGHCGRVFFLAFRIVFPRAFRVRWVVKWKLCLNSVKIMTVIHLVLFFTIGADDFACFLSVSDTHQESCHYFYCRLCEAPVFHKNMLLQMSALVRLLRLEPSGDQATVLLTSGGCASFARWNILSTRIPL